ncbi:hypothetical protein LCGC14_2948250 [marine sediment metagenome]|uniref:Uncharacterized protein n=1 Tax=marine sediment metagenome TaxID=412755 RepID=A0A0F8Y395_9ZZZZ
MTLRIKGTDSIDTEISLVRVYDGIEVWIGNDYMAKYFDDGRYIFHGKTEGNKYKDRWDK